MEQEVQGPQFTIAACSITSSLDATQSSRFLEPLELARFTLCEGFKPFACAVRSANLKAGCLNSRCSLFGLI